MKKRILKILSVFLICFTLTLTYTQERKKVNCSAEVVTLTLGTVYTVGQILMAAGVITSVEVCTITLAKAFLTSPYVSTEQDMRIRAMTPTSLDTPGTIEEEDLKSAYQFKEAIKNGTIVLPKTRAIQSFSAIGVNSIINTAKCSVSDAISAGLSQVDDTTNVHSVIRLHNLGTYRLTVNCKNGQRLSNAKTLLFENNDRNSAIRLYSQMNINVSVNGFYLLCDYVNSSNEVIDYLISSECKLDTNLRNFYSTSKMMGIAISSTFQDTFDLNLEYLGEGVGLATADVTTEIDTNVDTLDNSIPIAEADSICVNVPSSIANNWDTSATSDVISGVNEVGLENADGDTWDLEKGWTSELQNVSGILGDILSAIRSIGKDVWDFFEDILNQISGKIDDVISSIKELTWADVVGAITGLPTELLEVLGLEGLFSNVVDTILSIPQSIYNLFNSVLSSILEGVNSIVDDILEGLKKFFIPSKSFSECIDNLKNKYYFPKLSLPSSSISKDPITINKTVNISCIDQSYTIDLTLDQAWFPILRQIALGLMVLYIVFFAQRKLSCLFSSGGDD